MTISIPGKLRGQIIEGLICKCLEDEGGSLTANIDLLETNHTKSPGFHLRITVSMDERNKN